MNELTKRLYDALYRLARTPHNTPAGDQYLSDAFRAIDAYDNAKAKAPATDADMLGPVTDEEKRQHAVRCTADGYSAEALPVWAVNAMLAVRKAKLD